MSEKPILFTAPMVRAILEGRKTQTRRVVKPLPLSFWAGSLSTHTLVGITNGPKGAREHPVDHCWTCPYGAPGDTLWVREAWRVGKRYDDNAPRELAPRDMTVLYEAGGSASNENGTWLAGDWPARAASRPDWQGRYRPPMYMPRWASRLTLTVTAVRVERLNDISEADAEAEGVDAVSLAAAPRQATWSRRQDFAQLWESINAVRAPWSSNPWVWVIEFARDLPIEDQSWPALGGGKLEEGHGG